jgi:hypothetical protein
MAGLNEIIDKAFGISDNDSINSENGFANDTLFEPSNNFAFNKTNSETVIQGQNNAFIVLGRDRPGSEKSGYGGQGHSKCGAIDICVGRMSNMDASTLSGPVNPNTGADAARIYISQKADIDEYYNLVPGIAENSKARSAVAVKADDIRLIARNSFKIVTNTDNSLSNGASSLLGNGIQLIANNDDSDMQPMVKGDNLLEALTTLTEKIDGINSTLMKFMQRQKDFNAKIASHTHRTIVNGIPTLFSEQLLSPGTSFVANISLELEQECVAHSVSLNSWRYKYVGHGEKHISSSFHFLN